jgi:hypothetical protein
MDRRGFFKLLGIAGSIPLLGKFAHSAPPKLGFNDLKKRSTDKCSLSCGFWRFSKVYYHAT